MICEHKHHPWQAEYRPKVHVQYAAAPAPPPQPECRQIRNRAGAVIAWQCPVCRRVYKAGDHREAMARDPLATVQRQTRERLEPPT